MIIISGAASSPAEELAGQTPLEAASTPTLRRLAERGRVGGVVTLPPESPASPSVALGSLLGVDTHAAPTPAGPLLARRLRVPLGPDGVAWRVTFRASGSRSPLAPESRPTREETDALFEAIAVAAADAGVRLFAEAAGWGVAVTADDHEARAAALAEQARDLVSEHEVNGARVAVGAPAIEAIELDEPGPEPALEPLADEHGVTAALVSADEAALGLAECLAMTALAVEPDAAGEAAALAAAALAAIDSHDLVVVRTSSTRFAHDAGDALALADALADVDERLVAPLLARLEREGSDEAGGSGWRLLVASDLGAPDEAHTLPAPFLLAGDWVRAVLRPPLTEAAAAGSDLIIDPGFDLLEYALRSGLKPSLPRRARRSIKAIGKDR